MGAPGRKGRISVLELALSHFLTMASTSTESAELSVRRTHALCSSTLAHLGGQGRLAGRCKVCVQNMLIFLSGNGMGVVESEGTGAVQALERRSEIIHPLSYPGGLGKRKYMGKTGILEDMECPPVCTLTVTPRLTLPMWGTNVATGQARGLGSTPGLPTLSTSSI